MVQVECSSRKFGVLGIFLNHNLDNILNQQNQNDLTVFGFLHAANSYPSID